jgi:hypothetical protein
MVKIVSLAAMTLASFCSIASAQPAPADGSLTPDPAKFAEHKQMELQRISQRMQGLQTLQACVQGAADHAAMRACNEAARASMGRGGPGGQGRPGRAAN